MHFRVFYRVFGIIRTSVYGACRRAHFLFLLGGSFTIARPSPKIRESNLALRTGSIAQWAETRKSLCISPMYFSYVYLQIQSDTPCCYELSALYTVHDVLEKVCAGPEAAALVAPPGTASQWTPRYPKNFPPSPRFLRYNKRCNPQHSLQRKKKALHPKCERDRGHVSA